MLPDWKHVKYGLVLFISTVSLYDISEREVYSMALSENIKKYREEKNLTQQQLADKLYVSRQTVCRWEKGTRCPDLITAKKLALELDVSMDELISDESINDIQKNYGIWKSEKMINRMRLQEFHKKLLNFMEILGSIFLIIMLLFRVQLDMSVPLWCTIGFLCVEIPLFIANFTISKKLREM